MSKDLKKKEMATHSSILAWKIPWTEEPGRPQPMRSQRIGHDWVALLFFFPFIFISWKLITLQYCSGFVIHWHESAMGLHVFPIPIPPPTSLSTRSLWVFPVHQAQTLVSCIQPGLVICFTLDNTHVSMLFSRNLPPSPSPTVCFLASVTPGAQSVVYGGGSDDLNLSAVIRACHTECQALQMWSRIAWLPLSRGAEEPPNECEKGQWKSLLKPQHSEN